MWLRQISKLKSTRNVSILINHNKTRPWTAFKLLHLKTCWCWTSLRFLVTDWQFMRKRFALPGNLCSRLSLVVATNIVSLWLPEGSTKSSNNMMETIQIGCQIHCGELISLFFWKQTFNNSCTLAPPCGIISTIVYNVALCKQWVHFHFRWKHYCWTHTYRFHVEFKRFWHLFITKTFLIEPTLLTHLSTVY